MTMSDNWPGGHPQELLPFYALNALSGQEEAAVEMHVETCPDCRNVAASLQATAASLGAAAAAISPPAALRYRLMAAATGGSAPSFESGPAGPAGASWSLFGWIRPAGFLAPAAAVLVVLLVVSVAFNIYLAGTVGRLSESQAVLAARFLQMEHDDTDLVGYLSQSDVPGYLMENPSHEPLKLTAPGSNGEHRGVLLFAEDSRKCVLLIANMHEHGPSTSYHVWLWRPDQRVRMGEVTVDDEGWGMIRLFYPHESLLGFEKVYLSTDENVSEGEPPTDMVLEGSLAALRSGR